ncbi:metallophosphoesterase [Cellulomonas sp. NPDC057328]|uniref:metallophosphoesterase family protein n=1 Tax=Cellulomonas sp. NPDC057328 TaxID=3346101 RepID=UPI0036263F9B
MRTEWTEATRVVVAGDWHGDTLAAGAVVELAAARGATTLVHVGDLGIGVPGFVRDLEAVLASAGSILTTCGGNHDDWSWLAPAHRDAHGMRWLAPHLAWAPRGHRWSIGGRRIGALGGAVSVDAFTRQTDGAQYPDEAPTADDLEMLGSEPLDMLLAHDVPAGVPLTSRMPGIPADVAAKAQAVRELLATAVERTQPRLVFSGHWHRRLTHRLGSTTVEVLDMEWTTGNAVILDLATWSIEPLVRPPSVTDNPSWSVGLRRTAEGE